MVKLVCFKWMNDAKDERRCFALKSAETIEEGWARRAKRTCGFQLGSRFSCSSVHVAVGLGCGLVEDGAHVAINERKGFVLKSGVLSRRWARRAKRTYGDLIENG